MTLPNADVQQVPVHEILGYLNFSSGASDPRFLRRLNELWRVIEADESTAKQTWKKVQQVLKQTLHELRGTNAAFQDAEQAEGVLRLIFDEALPAYRRHHGDLLFHQNEADLWRPFFVGRVAEAVLTAGGPWHETKRIIESALLQLNDYVGHRPVAVLENHRHEPYSHERTRPIPLYIAGAGTAVGKYQALIDQTFAILQSTDRDLLAAAGFEMESLEELASDPRAYDFNHPVNRRPNYHFGQWDPHLINNKGRYRRFVVQQCTLDAVLARLSTSANESSDELLFEAGAVLAGTILMASGTSGGGPEAHDSSVSLATLLPHIARYRDDFYDRLLAKAPVAHRKRLEAEARARRQPFAGARQHLNAELARLRALQMQHVQLALLFARLGYPDAALRQSDIVPATSARMVCQMQCLLTTGHHSADAGRLGDAYASLQQAEEVLHRAIECGAAIDPWNILGFGGQFSLFPAIENSIPDPRVDELLDLIEQTFTLYSRLWHEAATVNHHELLKHLPLAFGKLADWWDRFATTAVEGLQHISGSEAVQAADRVATVLAAWQKAGEAAGQVAFWRPQVEQFHSPQAYSRVIEVLMEKHDLNAAMALLMHWLSQTEVISLDDGPRSFYALALRWMQLALACSVCCKDGSEPQWDLAAKFFDFLEANAGDYWDVPQWQPGEFSAESLSSQLSDVVGTEDDSDDDHADEDEGLFRAAYESMVYSDSTADNVDADMLDVPGLDGQNNDELEREQRRLSGRLSFLAMVAALWRTAALAVSAKRQPSATHPQTATVLPANAMSIPRGGLERANENCQVLLALATAVQRHPITISSASHDALIDYDRHRLTRETILEKVVATVVATIDAHLHLLATQPKVSSIPDRSASVDESTTARPASEIESIGPAVRATWTAVLGSDIDEIRKNWAQFLAELAERSLLYVPLARGGDARRIAAVRARQQMLRELLRRLPRLGLLRETCQLLRVARAMETNHPAGAGAVTEFDRLFEIAYKSIVECLVAASTQGESSGHLGSTRQRPTGRGTQKKQIAPSDPAADAQLIDYLQQVTESLLSEWLSHSRTVRLSVLERVATPKAWQELVKFVERYGHDVFTQQFFHLGNLRAILFQGVEAWLDRLSEDDEAAEQILLVRELDHGLSRAAAKKHLSLIIEAIVENYSEYRDYNATTTQSDRGELLYGLLDFLRAKVGYDRIQWNLRPVTMAHEVLVRLGRDGAAELWRRAMRERTGDVAEEQLKRLAELQAQYGMRLPTVADRLAERFVRPLLIDRVRALVAPAAQEARRDAPPAIFELLEQEAGELAQEPCGAGLDLPDWLESLEEEVNRVSNRAHSWDASTDMLENLPWKRLTWDEIQSQLTDWDTPPEAAS